jgi:hypothetical protein
LYYKKKLAKEKGYHPKQVFSCNKTRLFWKKMPNKTNIHRTPKGIPEHKIWKVRLILRIKRWSYNSLYKRDITCIVMIVLWLVVINFLYA